MGRPPTHLDSHQHVHRQEPARSVMAAAAAELRLPLREIRGDVAFVGGFYGQTNRGTPYPEGIAVETLVSIIESLPPGTSEISSHPGLDESLDSVYRVERITEVETLCSRGLRAALAQAGVTLISYADVIC
jgi:predicted glycoside hydrolase/deacetylase ChbG (UPF0249 family)